MAQATKPISPLRQRMLEDMALRRFAPKTQQDPRSTQHPGSYSVAGIGWQSEISGGIEYLVWCRITRERSRPPEGHRYRQPAYADPGRKGQGQT